MFKYIDDKISKTKKRQKKLLQKIIFFQQMLHIKVEVEKLLFIYQLFSKQTNVKNQSLTDFNNFTIHYEIKLKTKAKNNQTLQNTDKFNTELGEI